LAPQAAKGASRLVLFADGDDGPTERPKAQGQKPQAPPSPQAQELAATKDKDDEHTLFRTAQRIALNVAESFRPQPIENFALLLGDISVLLSFRIMEDLLIFPQPHLDIDAYPVAIQEGLSAYADPSAAISHIVK
jgi:hypothetical protein